MKDKIALAFFVLTAALLASGPGLAQEKDAVSQSNVPLQDSTRLSKTRDGLKRTDRAMYLYERTEREEDRKRAEDTQPSEVKITRVFPAGTGLDRIPLGADGKPDDPGKYRAELEKLLKSLEWAAQKGEEQKKSYEKIDKKLKERAELIDAMPSAFLFTFLGKETRSGRSVLKYRMEPNPQFKPANRIQSLLTKISGNFWIDESSSQLARVEGQIMQDVSFALFLGKINKGSHFMEERSEVAPGLWLPTVTKYDFDGRKFFSSISVHETTFYTNYRRVGTPAEAIPIVQAELAQLKPGGEEAQKNGP
jgi:hypothetical protein